MNMHQQLFKRSARDNAAGKWGRVLRDFDRRVLVAFFVLIAGLAVAYFLFGGANAPVEDPGANAPVVTIIVPGQSEVASTINLTGSIAARRDMPVGVQGEGGAITAVLVDAGDVVRAGQILARVDRSVQSQQVAQLEAAVREARANAALAQSELDRAQALVARGFISKADIDRRTATRDSANARVGVVAAQLNEARARLARLDIRAPDSGLVLERNVEAGQVVSAGGPPLFRMAKDGEFELKAKVAEQDLVRMKVGMGATVSPVGQVGSAVTGKVWQLSPIVDPTNRQGIARVSLDKNGTLRPGGFATAEIAVGTASVPLLPESAVLSDADGNFVYVVGPDNRVKRVGVVIGDVSDRGITIKSGLSGKEKIVYSAGGFLNPNDLVKPTPLTQ